MYLTNRFILTTIIALGVSTSASALEIGAGANIGGGSVGAGASVGNDSGASVGAGTSIGGSGGTVGVGVGFGHGSGGTEKPGSAVAARAKIIENSAIEAKNAKLEALIGATVTSSDRKMIGMVERVVAAPDNKIDVTIRLNAALSAQIPTVTLRMKMPKKNPKRIRLDVNENRFLKTISG